MYNSYGPYDVETRAKYVEDKLKELYEDPFFVADSIKIMPLSDCLSVAYQNKIIASITIVDALWENTNQNDLATKYINIIKNVITKYKEQNSLKAVLIRLGELCLVLLIAFVLIWSINKLFRFLRRLIINSEHLYIKDISLFCFRNRAWYPENYRFSPRMGSYYLCTNTYYALCACISNYISSSARLR